MNTLFWLIVLFFLLPSIIKLIAKNTKRSGQTIRINDNPLNAFFKQFFAQRATQTNSMNIAQMPHNLKKIIIAIGVVVVGVIILANILVVIPAGHTGVRTLFGMVKDRELHSGLNVVNPLETIHRMSIRTEEYTMSVTKGEGQRQGADQITVLTNEGLTVDLDITVFYRLQEDEASEVFRKLGVSYQEKIIRPEIRSAIREVVANFDAKAIYSEKRTEVTDGIRSSLQESLEPRGILIEQVLLRNVTLPPGLAGSIQQKLQAEQDAQRLDFVLEKEKKEAERKRIEAGGQRDAQRIINESLTPRYLEYLYVNGLKEREGTIYVPTSGSNGLPLFKGIE